MKIYYFQVRFSTSSEIPPPIISKAIQAYFNEMVGLKDINLEIEKPAAGQAGPAYRLDVVMATKAPAQFEMSLIQELTNAQAQNVIAQQEPIQASKCISVFEDEQEDAPHICTVAVSSGLLPSEFSAAVKAAMPDATPLNTGAGVFTIAFEQIAFDENGAKKSARGRVQQLLNSDDKFKVGFHSITSVSARPTPSDSPV